MNITVNEDRTVKKEYDENEGSQNENRITELNFTLPEIYSDFVHKIVFITEDGNYSDYIEDNKYILKNNVTRYRKVKSFVWLTDSVNNKDFRSEVFPLEFNYNEDPSDYIPSEQEKSQIELLMEELDELIQEVQSLPSMSREVVEELPTTDIDPTVIYMVLREDTEPDNIYDEWLYINDAWEKIGSTETDLSDYYTKTQADNKFVDKVAGKGLSTEDYTTAEKNKLAELENYDDTELSNKVDNLETTLDTAEKDIEELGNILYGEEELESTDSEVSFTGDENLELSVTEIDGKTEQDSTNGYQLLDNSKFISGSNNGITATINGAEIIANGTATATSQIAFESAENAFTLPAGQYTLTANNSIASSSINTAIRLVQTGETVISGSVCPLNNVNASKVITISESTTCRFQLRTESGEIFTNFKIKPMLESGSTAHEWEPYTNGASPNPDYPQEIKTVTGEQEVVVRGIQLFNKNDITIGYYYTDNSTSTSNSWGIAQVKVKPNTNYYLSGNNVNNTTAKIVLLDSNKTILSSVGAYATTHTITTTSNTAYIGLSIANYTDNSDLNTLLLEEGNSASPYEPYITPITKQLSLGDIELAKIGDYKDYIYKNNGKWYKKEYIGKYQFTGNETWFKHSTTSNNLFYISPTYNPIISNMKRPSTNGVALECYSEMAQYRAVNTMAGNSVTGINPSVAGDIYVGTSLSGISDRDVFKTYLQNHITNFYYLLENSIDTEITDTTLISQLEAIQKLQQITGTNIIEIVSTEGNLSADFKIVYETDSIDYLKDTKENKSNKTTTIDSTSTDEEYPSGKAVYTYVNGVIGDINSLLDEINRRNNLRR